MLIKRKECTSEFARVDVMPWSMGFLAHMLPFLIDRSLHNTFFYQEACSGLGAVSSGLQNWPSLQEQCICAKALKESIHGFKSIAIVFSSVSNKKLLCNLLSSSESLHPAMRVVTVSFHSTLHAALNQMNQTSILFPISSFSDGDVRFEKREKSQYQLISLARQLFILWALEHGANVLSLDTDIVMKANIMHFLPPQYDMYAQRSSCWPASHCFPICAGFVYYVSGNKTIALTRISIQSVIGGYIHQNAVKSGIAKARISLYVYPHDVVPHLNELYGCGGANLSGPVLAVHGALRSGGCGKRFTELDSDSKAAELRKFGVFNDKCLDG